MVDMLRKSDKSVPEIESVANETLSKNKDPNKNNNVTPSAAFFFHDAIQDTIVPDETVNVDENADLITEQEVRELLTPPCCCQNIGKIM